MAKEKSDDEIIEWLAKNATKGNSDDIEREGMVVYVSGRFRPIRDPKMNANDFRRAVSIAMKLDKKGLLNKGSKRKYSSESPKKTRSKAEKKISKKSSGKKSSGKKSTKNSSGKKSGKKKSGKKK